MPQQPAQVIATYSQRMRVRMADRSEAEARIKGKRLRPVCGDFVELEPIANEDEWLITAIQDRRNVLARPNMRGQTEILASNIELLLAVSAPSPKPDWFVVDRYLAAAGIIGVPAAVVFNKTDLDDELADAASYLDEYEAAGYPVLRCSAETGAGVAAIGAEIGEQVAIVVGQSGVGKSSIINELMGGEALRTAEISTKSGEGRHTTVNSVMLDLPGGGHVIDSPGVRDYAPALDSPADVVHGFREIETAGHECRFANCRHLQEPGCAVKAAVDEGSISARRYESYRRLLRLTDELDSKSRS
jgi:ribosome biogenesis GTPase